MKFTLFKTHWRKIFLFSGILVLIFFLPWIWIHFSTVSQISTREEQENFTEKKSVALVFGAAVYGKEKVSDVFGDRLRIASELYFRGKVEKILVSGDNRFENYNEPEAGKKFLLSLGISEGDIVLDYAGRRTFDTCWRAKNIFGIDSAYLSTQRFHLPRALFLCEEMGIDSFGVSASLQEYRGKYYNIFRESLAQQKAFYEKIFFDHPAEIMGEKIEIF